VCDVGLALRPGNYDATLTTFRSERAPSQLSAGQSMPLNVAKAGHTVLAPGRIRHKCSCWPRAGQVAAGKGSSSPTGQCDRTLSIRRRCRGHDRRRSARRLAPHQRRDANRLPAAAAAPNAIASLARSESSAHTVTVTPVAGTGSSAVSRTVTFRAPPCRCSTSLPDERRIYRRDRHRSDAPGRLSLHPTVATMAYDSANGCVHRDPSASSSSFLRPERKPQPRAGASGISWFFPCLDRLTV